MLGWEVAVTNRAQGETIFILPILFQPCAELTTMIPGALYLQTRRLTTVRKLFTSGSAFGVKLSVGDGSLPRCKACPRELRKCEAHRVSFCRRMRVIPSSECRFPGSSVAFPGTASLSAWRPLQCSAREPRTRFLLPCGRSTFVLSFIASFI